MKSFVMIACVCLAALAGCAELGEPDGALPEVSVNEQEISNYRIRVYFSDANMTQMVGERSNVCTSLIQWGQVTPWVYYDAGSCEYGGPSGWPGGSSNGSCDCCWDSNGNGSCDGNDGPFHVCSASFSCG